MPDCSRPPQRDQRGLTKNMSSVFGFGSKKGAYDDVFSTRPRIRAPTFTPGVKDYAEIFNRSQPSSIPVLELDEFERRDSNVDYGNVFGGFGDGRIGSSFEEVFCVGGDGVRRSNTSHAHSKGSDRSTAVEESQKLAHESLSVKKCSMPSEKITLGGKGGAYATNGEAKNTEAPLSARAADRNISLKNSGVSVSGATANHLKQPSEETPVEKHSRIVSSGGLSKNDADLVDTRNGNGHGLYKSVTSDLQMGAKKIRAKVRISEATNTCATSELLMGNSNGRNSNVSDNAEDDKYNFSQKDVKFLSVNSTRKTLVNNSTVDESDVRPQENSKSTPVTHAQLSFGKLNAAFEGPKIIASTNADSESTNMGSNEHLTNGVSSRKEVGLKESITSSMAADTGVVNFKSQNSKAIPPSGVVSNLDRFGSVLKKTDSSKSGEFKNINLSVNDSDSSSSSDDEMDKNSEAAISAAAVKKAIREAQTWIKIAKESNGVKGFMNHMAKKSGHVKVEKEAHNSKVKDKPKSSESGSASAASKDHIAPGSVSSVIKTGADDIVRERTKLCDSDRVQQMKDLEIQTSPRKNLIVDATIEHATPSFNTSEENLAYGSNVSEKLVQRKEDMTMQSMEVESEQVRLVSEAKCSEMPNVETRETEVNSVGKETSLNNFHESNTVIKITKAEKESQVTSNSNDQGFMIPSFQDDIGQFEVGHSANDFEVEEDVVPETQDLSNPNESVTCGREGPFVPCLDNREKDSTFSEEENVKQSELHPHDQVSDSEDVDSEDYASAEENWASTDTEDEANVSVRDLNLSVQNQPDEIDDMEATVAPEVTPDMENVLPPCFNNLNEDSIVEVEARGSEDKPFQNNLTHDSKFSSDERTAPTINYLNEEPVVEETNVTEDMLSHAMASDEVSVTSKERTAPVINYLNEDSVVGETDERLDMPLQSITAHEAGLTVEVKTEPFCNYSNEVPVVEGTCVRGNAPVLHIVTPESEIASEDGLSPCFSSSNKNSGVETEVIEVLTEQDMEIEDDTAPCFDKSNEDLSVEEIAVDTTEESRVSSPDYKHEKGATGVTEFCVHQQPTLNKEELDCVPRLEAESASRFDHELSHSEESVVDQISANVIIEASGAEPFEESRSPPSEYELKRQELGVVNHCNFMPGTADREELPNVAKVEPEVSENGHDSFEKDQATIDAAGQEEAVKLQSTPLHTEIATHELEAGVRFCESVPDFGENEETAEMEQQSENLVRQAEMHERKRWEIPKETFELPELKIKTSQIQDIMQQDGLGVERQMGKHERKKWEIPRETFELPVLGDQAVEESDEKEENAEQSVERVEKSAEKPERKKWNIQKEAFEVPILLAEGVQETSEHEGFEIETASEEEEAGSGDILFDNRMLPEGVVQHAAVETDCSAIGEVAVPCNAEEDQSQMQLNEMFHEQEECATKPGEINVKDEIKRTLGKLWKKIYASKEDGDSELLESVAKEEASFKDRIEGVDLNLKGPVELVESPRQHDDIEALNFSGRRSRYEEIREEASCSEPFEVNGSSTCDNIKFLSTTEITEEVQDNSLSAFDSCELHEDEKKSKDEVTCKQNYSANDVESLSEEIPSSDGSEDLSKMAPSRGVELKREGNPEMTSDVNECGRIDSETVCGLQHPMPDDSSVDYAENTQKVKKVLQQNGSENAHDGVADENKSEDEAETHLVDDSSDKTCPESEKQGSSASRQESKSDSDNNACNATSSHKFEQKEDKNVAGPDLYEQAIRWKWIFGGDLRDKSNGKDEATDVDLPREGEAKTKEMADETNTSLVTGKEEIICENPPIMEENAAKSIQKEVTPDQEVVKKMMRAKEMERMVVERAIREARERAFAEARERAARERANAGTHQKVTANDQDRSKKMSSEAKLAAEKNDLEAKRKAELERAAVERATAEARQRALEKAMYRKDQVSQSGSSRPNSASNDHYGSSSKDRLSDDKPSESALRFKARNERHQRIAERAAKALAEKNMRDLLVQREQAERNRLAEVLDADVKRWARGKTGNLRALLSTLQYILGPDSGWQPIHLTDVVTADAVKKAYRKATLFVHPDKLQQRGATIRQKYICEKVFDLLKEAWNKFDRDER